MKCKLERNMELIARHGKPIVAQGQEVIEKNCLKCGKPFHTIPSTNFIFCGECGKLPKQKQYK